MGSLFSPSVPHEVKHIGKYEIVRELGSGATSRVYLAFDPFNNQRVALKLFNQVPLRDSMSVSVSQAASYRGLSRGKIVASAYRQDN